MSEATLYGMAHSAGVKAAESVVPKTMYVRDGETTYAVEDGVCGFAWVNIRPARGKFVSWLKRSGIGRKSYEGGYDLHIFEFGQSMTRKEEYAKAFAKVLRDNGVTAYSRSRMD